MENKEGLMKALTMINNKECAGVRMVNGEITKVITFADERMQRTAGMCKKQYSKIYPKIKNFYRKCCICDFDRIVQLHHIIPLSRGGESNRKNILPVCPIITL